MVRPAAESVNEQAGIFELGDHSAEMVASRSGQTVSSEQGDRRAAEQQGARF